MADKRSSDFDDAAELDGSEYVTLVQNGENVKILASEFAIQIINSISGMIVLADCGEYDVSTNLFPETGGTGAGGAVKRGNEFKFVGSGTLGESPISEELKMTGRALVDAPGQVEANWKIY